MAVGRSNNMHFGHSMHRCAKQTRVATVVVITCPTLEQWQSGQNLKAYNAEGARGGCTQKEVGGGGIKRRMLCVTPGSNTRLPKGLENKSCDTWIGDPVCLRLWIK